jgi:hypothetical protein
MSVGRIAGEHDDIATFAIPRRTRRRSGRFIGAALMTAHRHSRLTLDFGSNATSTNPPSSGRRESA